VVRQSLLHATQLQGLMATEEPTHAEGKGGKERISGMKNTATWLIFFFLLFP